MVQGFECDVGGQKLTLEVGRLMTQASGAVTARLGDTVVLATATITPEPREGIDFFPLLIDFEEKYYASGKIAGSRFVRREGKATDNAIMTARLIDRPLRPLFPKGFYNDVQIVVTVLSADLVNDPDVVGIVAASVALMLTGAPFAGPVGAVRVGRKEGKFLLNPSYEEAGAGEMDLVVAATEDKVMMLEAGMREIDEKTLLEAIRFAHKNIQPLIQIQNKLAKLVKSGDYKLIEPAEELLGKIKSFIEPRAEKAIYQVGKKDRNTVLEEVRKEVWEEFVSEENPEQVVGDAFSRVIGGEFRRQLLAQNRRPDGRKLDEIRPLSCEVKVLPRPHGSALFTRGETQVLSVVTLGGSEDEQIIDSMDIETRKRYMHHYNFPPFATGEVKPLRGASRREIGHGALAERALLPMVPSKEEFPYTIRVVSEILSSNGSSSMASVCSSSLALMDAGVPLRKAVAGIAMGLVYESEEKYKVLTDIAGIEDFNGDMDFKIAGSRDGLTAIQLDVKIAGVTLRIIEESLSQARQAQLEILEKMEKVIKAPRSQLSPYAPHVVVVKIPPTKIRDVIGPGGRVINQFIEEAGGREVTTINVEQDGSIFITSSQQEMAEKTASAIAAFVQEVEVGKVYQGRVTRTTDFGAFVEVLPGKEGLVHISELADRRVDKVSDVVKVGDTIPVLVKEIDELGRINLSYKRALNNQK